MAFSSGRRVGSMTWLGRPARLGQAEHLAWPCVGCRRSGPGRQSPSHQRDYFHSRDDLRSKIVRLPLPAAGAIAGKPQNLPYLSLDTHFKGREAFLNAIPAQRRRDLGDHADAVGCVGACSAAVAGLAGARSSLTGLSTAYGSLVSILRSGNSQLGDVRLWTPVSVGLY